MSESNTEERIATDRPFGARGHVCALETVSQSRDCRTPKSAVWEKISVEAGWL